MQSEQNKEMRAICFPEKKKAELIQVPLPQAENDNLIVKIEYSAISPGTERWMLQGKLEIPGEPPFEFPHIPGYQAAGTIVGIGTQNTGFRVGDRVFSRGCKPPEGWKGSWWGGHCEYHIAKAGRDIIRVPDNVSTEVAACLLLAQVGYNGASKPVVEKGGVAVIIGDGLVGQYAAQVLGHRGAHTVLSGLSSERLTMAERYSAAEIYDNRNFDFPDYIARRYPNGVDIVLETASTMKTVEEAAGMLKRDGQLVLNGYYPPGESCIDWHWIRRKELTLYCADSRNDARLKAAMDLIAKGAIKVKELITHRFFPEQVQDAYSMLLRDRQDYLGLLIDWR